MEKEKIIEVLKKLRKETKKRNFSQSVDLIINLKDFDIKKESVNLFLGLPHKVKKMSVCAFLNKKSEVVDSITGQEFEKYKDKKEIKKLVKKYDFFISSASLMPQVARSFGRYLGPVGKMPSPQLGIVKHEDEKEIKKILDGIEEIVRVKSKEASLKFCIGKENMKDEEIAENIITAYNSVLNVLPRKKENIKTVMIKFTMSGPKKLEV
jgi:large subunit ribosomal protein L1